MVSGVIIFMEYLKWPENVEDSHSLSGAAVSNLATCPHFFYPHIKGPEYSHNSIDGHHNLHDNNINILQAVTLYPRFSPLSYFVPH